MILVSPTLQAKGIKAASEEMETQKVYAIFVVLATMAQYLYYYNSLYNGMQPVGRWEFLISLARRAIIPIQIDRP